MKFKVTVTKDVIDRSLMCGVGGSGQIASNCAFAVLYTDLVPNVVVTGSEAAFYKNKRYYIGGYVVFDDQLQKVGLTEDQKDFIRKFDSRNSDIRPEGYGYYMDRYELVGQEFDIEIPDAVIDYWYKDASEVAAKIANLRISGHYRMV